MAGRAILHDGRPALVVFRFTIAQSDPFWSAPAGYKVVYIPEHGTQAGSPQDLITGWLASSTSYVFWGRPVGVLVAADGSLLVSDDDAGVIYRLAPLGR